MVHVWLVLPSHLRSGRDELWDYCTLMQTEFVYYLELRDGKQIGCKLAEDVRVESTGCVNQAYPLLQIKMHRTMHMYPLQLPVIRT